MNIYQDAAKARRSAASAIKSLERALTKTSSKNGRRGIRREIRTLKRESERSKRGSGYSIENAISNIRSITNAEHGMRSRQRANKVEAQQISGALNPKILSQDLGQHSYVRSKLFYTSTRRLWEGKGNANRNREILKGLRARGVKVSTIGEAYDWVVFNEKNEEARKMAEGSDWYQTIGGKSPDWVAYTWVIR